MRTSTEPWIANNVIIIIIIISLRDVPDYPSKFPRNRKFLCDIYYDYTSFVDKGGVGKGKVEV